MFRILRRAVKFYLTLFLAAVLLMAVYLSPPVQKFLYPVPQQEYVFRYAAEYELNPYLVAAVIRVESKFLHKAESASGARGLMQLMPDTAQWAAGKMGIPFQPSYLFQPKYNIRMGCWYLRELLDEYNGNLTAALAAYNGGRGNVSGWLKNGIWNGTYERLDEIPFEETRVYVARVMRDYHRYQNLYTGYNW